MDKDNLKPVRIIYSCRYCGLEDIDNIDTRITDKYEIRNFYCYKCMKKMRVEVISERA